MIRPREDGPQVYLCVEPVDGRKQINGLAQLVQDQLELNPFSEQLFVFSQQAQGPLPDPVLGAFGLRAVAQAPGQGSVSPGHVRASTRRR